jgi:branched-chain amino acid transport system ATP-binding protein
MSEPILKVANLTKRFGGLSAVSDLSFEVERGQIMGLIGPNGAGKTTAFNAITGLYPPTSGDVHFNGQNVTGMRPHQLARHGLARTFQLTTVFPGLTVLENVVIASHLHAQSYGFVGSVFRTRASRRGRRDLEHSAEEVLELVGIVDSRNKLAGELPHGHLRLLEIASALATRPRLLMLDEPATGMNVSEADATMHLIRNIREKMQLTILLVEHDMKVVMGVCERILVISFGAKLAEGTPAEICADESVIEAYLGSEELCLA